MLHKCYLGSGLPIFQISSSSSSLKSLVSSKSSTLLSELEFYDYHEGRPFTSHVITKRIVEIKETKTTFGSQLTNDSLENSKSKLQFTGTAICSISNIFLASLARDIEPSDRTLQPYDISWVMKHDSRKSEINSHSFIDNSFVKLPLNLSQKVSLWRYKCNIFTRFDKL